MIRNMQICRLILALFVVTLVSVPIAAAVCDAEFSALIADINSASFKNAKDQTALLRKANEAQAKANSGKRADAIKKLNEIIAKTNTLTSNGKITSGGSEINTTASNVIQCLQQ
jgi:hypothetical protein